MSSNDVIIKNDLPAEIIALQYSTLDQAFGLIERAHAIAIPSAKIDEQGCRSALASANTLYKAVEDLEKELEQARLERGREINAIKARVDEAVKAATGPLLDQRRLLGAKLFAAGRELEAVIAEKKRAAELERLRREAEQRAVAEAARKAAADAEAAAVAAAEAARKAADVAAMTGADPLPDDAVAVAAAQAAETAANAADTAAKAQAVAIERVFEAKPAAYIAPAPKLAVKSGGTDYSLQIDNLALVPDQVAGVPLRVLDEKAALKLLRAGVEIPGLTLVETERAPSSKGRSNAFAV